MKFLDFIKQNGLDMFASKHELQSVFPRFSLDYIGPYKNGYRFTSGKTEYRVWTDEGRYGSLVYRLERIVGCGWEEVRSRTDTEERRFPKCPAWLGTLLVRQRENDVPARDERQFALFA